MRALLCALAMGLVLGPLPAAAEGDVIEDVVAILRREGMIDAATERKILIKLERQRAEPEKQAHGGLEWYGDFRLRYELFDFDTDTTGSERDNRYRFRYRARLGFTKKLTDWAKLDLRLASGSELSSGPLSGLRDRRSTNRTLGDNEDFDPDLISVDRAYLDFTLLETEAMSAHLAVGKVSNPFLWRNGKDFLIWDSDLNPEGAFLRARFAALEHIQLFATFGAFIDAENSTRADPKLAALQLGGTAELSETLRVGLRVSSYFWRSLDTDFITRSMLFGNLTSAFDHSGAHIGEVSGFARIATSEVWPLLAYGIYVQNFEAERAVIGTVPVSEEDEAWGAGFEIGSSRRFALLGVGYFHVEANSVMALFTDSDLFDGRTNREGFAIYAARKLSANTELRLSYFDADEIENTGGAAGPFSSSIADASRRRLQTDINFKF